MTLEGRVALVTGGSRGLGLAIARALAADGARLALMARAGDDLDRAVREVSAISPCIAVAADVTRAAEVDDAVQHTVAELGGLDLLVLNAGTWQGSPIAETSEAMWDLLIDLNLKGAFLVLKAAFPHLVARRRGTVVGISSLGGMIGTAGSAAYAASKWGLRGLLESAANELRPSGVRVSLVHPHNINSAGRDIAPGSEDRAGAIEPAEIASLVAWICGAPDHVAVGNVTIWPIAAGLKPYETARAKAPAH